MQALRAPLAAGAEPFARTCARSPAHLQAIHTPLHSSRSQQQNTRRALEEALAGAAVRVAALLELRVQVVEQRAEARLGEEVEDRVDEGRHVGRHHVGAALKRPDNGIDGPDNDEVEEADHVDVALLLAHGEGVGARRAKELERNYDLEETAE